VSRALRCTMYDVETRVINACTLRLLCQERLYVDNDTPHLVTQCVMVAVTPAAMLNAQSHVTALSACHPRPLRFSRSRSFSLFNLICAMFLSTPRNEESGKSASQQQHITATDITSTVPPPRAMITLDSTVGTPSIRSSLLAKAKESASQQEHTSAATDGPSRSSHAMISPGLAIAQRGPLAPIQESGTSAGRFATSGNNMVRGIASRILLELTLMVRPAAGPA
jgi:hypothetical protein